MVVYLEVEIEYNKGDSIFYIKAEKIAKASICIICIYIQDDSSMDKFTHINCFPRCFRLRKNCFVLRNLYRNNPV